MVAGGRSEEQAPLLGGREGSQDGSYDDDDVYGDPQPCKEVPPQVCTKLIARLKALVLKLIPLQVEDEELTAANGSIITPDAVKAFLKAGGDFQDAIPYCLLVARRSFGKDAYRNPSDYDEHMNRRLACEVIARRTVQLFPSDRQHIVLSTRYSHIESDGDVSLPLSAIELASDEHCPIFLSSGEAQKTIFALWKGHLVQGRDSRGHVIYKAWKPRGGLDPSRLAVPRYQNILRIFLWILFLVCYTLAIQTPDREFGLEDYIFYIQVFGYTLEEIVRIVKIRSLAALTFWTCVSLGIYTIAFIALGFRIADLSQQSTHKAHYYRLKAFQILSCAAPLVWSKLLTVFDLFSFFGSMQIVVGRMMKESLVFFTLLAILSMGFLQALTGLDVADDKREATGQIVHSLLQGLLGSPDFETYSDNDLSYPYGMILYYAWSILTLIILLNILIALFNSAYENVAGDAMAQYMAFFAQKTIASVRAPDQFVYVAPFNLIELFLLPFELCLPVKAYSKINQYVLSVLFFPALIAIAVYEHYWEKKHSEELKNLIEDNEDEQFHLDKDPSCDDISAADGEISTVPFDELVKAFPDLQTSTSSQILSEVKKLKKELAEIKQEIEEGKVKKEEEE